MKVYNPEFNSEGEVCCSQCPLIDAWRLCSEWSEVHKNICPTKETYAEACKLAGV